MESAGEFANLILFKRDRDDAVALHDVTVLINLRDIATEARVREEYAGWQPIETAPKDGTWILVWMHDYECPMSAQWGLLNINPNKYDGIHGWSGNGYIFDGVTHWMPMPEAPKAALEGKVSQ